ncbi:MAG: phage baseplate assembly protein [Desulfobulbia bacterium]
MVEENPVDVELLLDGRTYAGWKSVSVRRSLDSFASSFDLTLTDNQAGEARTIKLGSPCQVRIGGEKLITGYVDRIRPKYDAKRRSLTVSGRSKVADLVDCSLPPGTFGAGQQNSRTLLQLAATVGKRFGVTARSEVAGLEPIRISNLSPEQNIFEFLELHARTAGVRLVDDQDGNIVISRAGKERVTTALVLGENIEEGDGEFSERDRFSEYYFYGQSSNSLDNVPEAAAHISGVAKDTAVRYRPTVVIAEGAMDGLGMAKRRAEWQRNVQYGRSRQATYTLSGWKHEKGLWQPNTNVLVQDEWMGFTGKDGKGEWLMIGTVEFVLDGGGQRTRLTVMPAEAYDLIPLPAEEAGAGVF